MTNPVTPSPDPDDLATAWSTCGSLGASTVHLAHFSEDGKTVWCPCGEMGEKPEGNGS